MISMQYSFVLPADYDMAIVERRVREKGSALDEHKPLLFKVYLMARRGDPATHSQENLYAPFYLWHDTAGMRDFLCSKGFQGLVGSFGWPSVRTWPLMIEAICGPDIAEAQFATREIRPIASFALLDDLRTEESRIAADSVRSGGALAAITAFEATTWTLVRFHLRRQLPPTLTSPGVQAYNVLHVSHPS